MTGPEHPADDDQLMTWFTRALVDNGDVARTREVEDGVVEIHLEDQEGRPHRAELLVTRAQLRRAVEDLIRPVPERSAVVRLVQEMSETLATIRVTEPFVVLDRGDWHASTRRELPPLPDETMSGPVPPADGYWSSYAADDPRFGEPGSIFGIARAARPTCSRSWCR